MLGRVLAVIEVGCCFCRDCSTESTITSKASGSDVVGVDEPVEDPLPYEVKGSLMDMLQPRHTSM